MKFVVWGKGVRGLHLIDLLSSEKIAAIVDQNKELQGTLYGGIQIISPETYLKEYRYCPILVTPRGYEEEIIQQLNQAGIYWAFSFTSEYQNILSVFRQVSIEERISQYKTEEELSIWGYNALSLLLYDFLCDKGYSCRLIWNDLATENVKKYLENDLGIILQSKKECKINKSRVLVTTQMSENEKIFLTGNKMEKYYDLMWESDSFFNPLLEQYKNKHEGKRCFIVATGPSLNVMDLNTLYNNNEICISVNGIFAAFAHTAWRPDYYIIADPEVFNRWEKEIAEFSIKEKFIADIACEHPDELGLKWHCINTLESNEIFKFSEDFARNSYNYGSITHSALQLAVYMGCAEIYLLGVDFNYQLGSSNNHFYIEKKKDSLRANVEFMRRGYMIAKEYADTHGIKIYNATRGGMLEVFERVNFDSLF